LDPQHAHTAAVALSLILQIFLFPQQKYIVEGKAKHQTSSLIHKYGSFFANFCSNLLAIDFQ
jgi:hypothetical protein